MNRRGFFYTVAAVLAVPKKSVPKPLVPSGYVNPKWDCYTGYTWCLPDGWAGPLPPICLNDDRYKNDSRYPELESHLAQLNLDDSLFDDYSGGKEILSPFIYEEDIDANS